MPSERLIGNAPIDSEGAIGSQSTQIAWRWRTNKANKVARNIYVRVPASGQFADGARAQLWKVEPAPERKRNIDISGLAGTPGAWVAVPGFAAESLVQNAFYDVAVFHPPNPGTYWFKSGFGNPASGSLSGQCVFRNNGTEDDPPNDLTFAGGAFGVDIEIDDAPASSDGKRTRALVVKKKLEDILNAAVSVTSAGTQVTYGFPRTVPERRWALLGDIRWLKSDWVTSGKRKEEIFAVEVTFAVQVPGGDGTEAEALAVDISADFESMLQTNPGLDGLCITSSLVPQSLRSWPIDKAYEAEYKTEVFATCRL